VRARSAAELRDRLKQGGFAQETIASVVSDLESVKLVDDEEFARAWVTSRRAMLGIGKRRLRWELRSKGVSEELIGRVVDEGIEDESEVELAAELARRRLRGQGKWEKELGRLRRLLVGKGFERDAVESALRSLSREMER
jgi:regulatory protein